ncbi:transcriptional repressor DicA [Lentilactobacillus sunkii]|jgi:transcriptional regulator with XRE-family HTH domain|uniref:Transcriptional repressor DicA n=1 Tax=Lentilactobacillus sunkii TaxID=481719 RepID=A0A1E7XGS0_9LACO|nr:helix-turn-helix domain-containing protein [Lentilactobacillus sunkii]OFA12316.1 transcriptional repressor DicA [Lentilactobacillus sunkii]
MVDDHFAQQLKARRKDSSLTQQQLADKLNVSRKTISGWETGRNRPDIDILRQMAEIYHISLDQLVSDVRFDNAFENVKHSEMFRFTNNIVNVIFAMLVAERLTQSSPKPGFLWMDELILFVLGLRIIRSRFVLSRFHKVMTPVFYVGYGFFTIAAIFSSFVNLYKMGLNFQYVIGFSGILALFNLTVIAWHKVMK